MPNVDPAEVALIEEKVRAETERIEEAEERIEAEEKKIKAAEKVMLQAIKGQPSNLITTKGASFNRIELMRQLILRKISRKKFVFTLIGIFGVVLVWRGIWEVTEVMPILQYSVVALLVGIGILWLIERYTDLL